MAAYEQRGDGSNVPMEQQLDQEVDARLAELMNAYDVTYHPRGQEWPAEEIRRAALRGLLAELDEFRTARAAVLGIEP